MVVVVVVTFTQVPGMQQCHTWMLNMVDGHSLFEIVKWESIASYGNVMSQGNDPAAT